MPQLTNCKAMHDRERFFFQQGSMHITKINLEPRGTNLTLHSLDQQTCLFTKDGWCHQMLSYIMNHLCATAVSSIFKTSRLKLASVSRQAGFNLTWLHTSGDMSLGKPTCKLYGKKFRWLFFVAKQKHSYNSRFVYCSQNMTCIVPICLLTELRTKNHLCHDMFTNLH